MSEIEHIAVPIDDWDMAEGIVQFAETIARAFGARVTLLHVAPDVYKLPTEQQMSALAVHERICEEICGKTRLDVALRMGDPATEIVKFALTDKASLIAMPTHGRHGMDRMIHGSVTETVLRLSPVPVLMSNEARRQAKAHPLENIRKILLAVYTSMVTEAIMPIVISLARKFDAEVVLYHDDLGINDVGTPLDPQEALLAIEQSTARLKTEGVRHSVVHASSAPVVGDIVARINALDIDLVAMATHGRQGLMRGLLGSITEAVLRNSPCPVLSSRYQP